MSAATCTAWPLLFPPDEFEGVRLESQRSVVKLLTRAPTLDEPEITRLGLVLGAAFPPELV